MEPFPVPVVLAANPQLDDYFHVLRFSADGSVALYDGGGHSIIAVARGAYAVQVLDQSSAIVTLENLVEIDAESLSLEHWKQMYQAGASTSKTNDGRVVRELASCRTKVVRESGPFVFDWPYGQRPGEEQLFQLFNERYVFETDPLSFAHEREQQHPYFHLVMKPLGFSIDSGRYYYPPREREKVTVRQLEALGIVHQGRFVHQEQPDEAVAHKDEPPRGFRRLLSRWTARSKGGGT